MFNWYVRCRASPIGHRQVFEPQSTCAAGAQLNQLHSPCAEQRTVYHSVRALSASRHSMDESTPSGSCLSRRCSCWPTSLSTNSFRQGAHPKRMLDCVPLNLPPLSDRAARTPFSHRAGKRRFGSQHPTDSHDEPLRCPCADAIRQGMLAEAERTRSCAISRAAESRHRRETKT